MSIGKSLPVDNSLISSGKEKKLVLENRHLTSLSLVVFTSFIHVMSGLFLVLIQLLTDISNIRNKKIGRMFS